MVTGSYRWEMLLAIWSTVCRTLTSVKKGRDGSNRWRSRWEKFRRAHRCFRSGSWIAPKSCICLLDRSRLNLITSAIRWDRLQQGEFFASGISPGTNRFFIKEKLEFCHCVVAVALLFEGAGGNLVDERMRTFQRVRFAAGGDDFVHFLLHELRVGEQNESDSIQRVAGRRLLQLVFCAGKISVLDG